MCLGLVGSVGPLASSGAGGNFNGERWQQEGGKRGGARGTRQHTRPGRQGGRGGEVVIKFGPPRCLYENVLLRLVCTMMVTNMYVVQMLENYSCILRVEETIINNTIWNANIVSFQVLLCDEIQAVFVNC